MCGNLWISEDGGRIYTRCGNTFRASPLADEDMSYAGALPEVDRVQTLAHSGETDLVAMVPELDFFGDGDDGQVLFFDHEFLQSLGATALPEFSLQGEGHELHGRFVFFNADGTELYAITEIDASAGLLNDSALVRLRVP